MATLLLGGVFPLTAGSDRGAAPAGHSAAAVSATGDSGGTELYGYLPYWEMSASMATYLAGVPLTSIELFSVSTRANGSIDTKPLGYRRITGSIGQRLIAEAHARGQRVELAFSSFGFARNAALFGASAAVTIDHRWSGPLDAKTPSERISPARRTAADLATLVERLGVDGINLDVEQIAATSYDGYAAFVRDLRTRLLALRPGARLSAATMASQAGANLAYVAVAAGVDRIFMMGYDYHWSGSQPGGSAPVDRLDRGASLTSSIAIYRAVGVPADRILLGLPLYGMSWPTVSSDRYAERSGRGAVWTPTKHKAQLTAPGFEAHLDPLEVSEYLAEPVPATTSSPGVEPTSSPGVEPPASPDAEPASPTWRAVFYDSPRTLRTKLSIARAAGYAGGGFWAIGYERGIPGYTELMAEFLAGEVEPAPVAQPEAGPPVLCRGLC